MEGTGGGRGATGRVLEFYGAWFMGLGSEWEVAGSRILWGLVYGVGWVRNGRWGTIMMSTMMI